MDLDATCQDGDFELGGLPAGEYNVSFTAWCYDLHPQQPPTPWVTLAEGEHASRANIGLCPEIQGPTPEPTEGPSPTPEPMSAPTPLPAIRSPDTGDAFLAPSESIAPGLLAVWATLLVAGSLCARSVWRSRR